MGYYYPLIKSELIAHNKDILSAYFQIEIKSSNTSIGNADYSD